MPNQLKGSAWHAYRALLWSETTEDGTPLDALDAYGSDALRDRVASDWQRFRDAAEALGFDAVEHRASAINSAEGDEWDYAAHDFILTRNGHGAGFWDGHWAEPWGTLLTDLAHSFGELHAYCEGDVIELGP